MRASAAGALEAAAGEQAREALLLRRPLHLLGEVPSGTRPSWWRSLVAEEPLGGEGLMPALA